MKNNFTYISNIIKYDTESLVYSEEGILKAEKNYDWINKTYAIYKFK